MGKLTELTVKALTKPGRHGDGDGLYLNIAPSGSRSWVQRIVIHRRRRDIGLGPYPAVSLDRARSIAQENRSAVAHGRDPVAEKREAIRNPAPSIPTFSEAASRVIELRRPTWSNPKHAAQWQSTLQTYVFPLIGNKAVDAITSADVLEVLSPIWTGKPETASRVRQRMETVMDWAVAQGYRLDNPAGRSLLKVLPKTQRVKEHHQAFPYFLIPDLVRQVRGSTANISTKLAFEFLILTASRSREVREADWSEIDWQLATWEIPASRMKGRRPHLVPLSTGAAAMLWQAWKLNRGQGLIFPAAHSGKPGSEMVFGALLRRLEIPAVLHGFRTSFRNWAAECTPTPWAVAEEALAHNTGNSTEAQYPRSGPFLERRALMLAWSDFVTGGADTERQTSRPTPNTGDSTEPKPVWEGSFPRVPERTEAQEAYRASFAERTEGNTPEEIRDEYFRDVLEDKIPGIPKFADLPSWWRNIPEEFVYSGNPLEPDRRRLLAIYIDMAKEQPWAWDGLCSLLRQMLENGEPIPESLGIWGVDQLVNGGRPRKRGPRERFDTDLRVWGVFTVLRLEGWSRRKSYDYIARLTDYDSRVIRGTIRKEEQRLQRLR